MVPLRPQLPLGATRATSSQIHRLAQELINCKCITVLSGAGISTECGLSDYRSPGKKYAPRPPINHHQYITSATTQKLYWARSFIGYPLLSTAKPGLSHHALSSLHGRLGNTFNQHVTQNVDGLLQGARTPLKSVIELHGSIHRLQCRDCLHIEERTSFQSRLIPSNIEWAKLLGSKYEHRPDGDADITGEMVELFTLPGCVSCGMHGMVMPTVVFHGGSVPKHVADQATHSVQDCDALLIVGSSMSTYSAFRLAKLAKNNGKRVFIVNYGPTRADDLVDLKVHALVGDSLARLADLLIDGGFHPPDDMLSQSDKHCYGGKLQL